MKNPMLDETISHLVRWLTYTHAPQTIKTEIMIANGSKRGDPIIHFSFSSAERSASAGAGFIGDPLHGVVMILTIISRFRESGSHSNLLLRGASHESGLHIPQ